MNQAIGVWTPGCPGRLSLRTVQADFRIQLSSWWGFTHEGIACRPDGHPVTRTGPSGRRKHLAMGCGHIRDHVLSYHLPPFTPASSACNIRSVQKVRSTQHHRAVAVSPSRLVVADTAVRPHRDTRRRPCARHCSCTSPSVERHAWCVARRKAGRLCPGCEAYPEPSPRTPIPPRAPHPRRRPHARRRSLSKRPVAPGFISSGVEN